MKPALVSLSLLSALALASVGNTPPAFGNTQSSVEPAEVWLSAEQVAADIAIAESAYANIHPGYTRYASSDEMRAAWQAVINEADANGGMSVGDFYLAINLTVTNIRCDHTKAELPSALREARSGQPLYLPFVWEYIEGRGIVNIVDDGLGLERGDEILSIDGRSLSNVAATVGRYIPVDGFTEWSRNGGISSGNEFMGGGVDHFGALLWDIPSQATLEIRKTDGSTETVMVPRTDYEGWVQIGQQAGLASNFSDAIRFERVGENAAYLAVDTFVNYRSPVDPQELYQPIFNALQEEDRDTLILDLRQNGGGSTDASMGLMANLVPNARQFMLEFRAATLDHTPWEGMIGTWDQAALNPNPLGFIANDDGSYTLRQGVLEDTGMVTPTDVSFDGRLIILTSSNNSSGSTNILAQLASRPDTVTIGERTGGSAEGPTAGVIFFLTLPESNVRMRIPMFRQWNNTENFVEGMGITPMISAPMTVEAFIEGRDPAMEQAVAMVSQPS